MAADAKLGFDDNAAFRQKGLFDMRDESQEDPRWGFLGDQGIFGNRILWKSGVRAGGRAGAPLLGAAERSKGQEGMRMARLLGTKLRARAHPLPCLALTARTRTFRALRRARTRAHPC